MIDVVIPIYRKPEQVKRCIDALASQNGSGSITIWQEDNNTHNRGFTKAVNDGILKGSQPYIVVLNQDCYLDPDALDQAVEFMDAHPRCAIAGAKQLLDADPDQIVHGGCTVAYPAGRHIVGRVSRGDCNAPARMPWVNGACMIVRRSALPYIGLMDESMFLVGSDSDWCYTARARGFEVWYAPSVVCRHECGVSSQPSPEVMQIMQRDMTAWADKWIGSTLHARLVSTV
jgi:GT2 family glycosyltransferase